MTNGKRCDIIDKMDFLSERARMLTPYTAGEQLKDKRYIKLNTNENPYPPSPRLKDLFGAFDESVLKFYPAPDAGVLREQIALCEGVGKENVFCGNGSDEVLFLSFAAFFDGTRPVCFADITYTFYEVYAKFFGVTANVVPLNGDFTVNLSEMAERDCAGYFIANPNAPTGVGIPLDEMERFIASVPEKIVIADEAYMDFYGESCVPLTKKYENLLVVKTFSKSYSLAGIRCGYAVGNAALVRGLFNMKDCMNSYPVDAVCEAVCVQALLDREYHEKTVALVVSERERLRRELLALGFTVPESKANFLFAGRAPVSAREIYLRLKEEGVLVRFWDKPLISDFCRITVGTREETDVLLKKLKKILT